MIMQPSWDKTDSYIKGNYMGIFPYTGIVVSTRVCFGGDVQFTVKLTEDISVYGDIRDTILVKQNKDFADYQFV